MTSFLKLAAWGVAAPTEIGPSLAKICGASLFSGEAYPRWRQARKETAAAASGDIGAIHFLPCGWQKYNPAGEMFS